MSSNATVVNTVAPPAVPSLDSTFGAILVGTFLGLMYVPWCGHLRDELADSGTVKSVRALSVSDPGVLPLV